MKTATLFLFANLLTASAFAGSYAHQGTVVCKGTMAGKPAYLQVIWGAVKGVASGSLPPYLIDQKQAANVVLFASGVPPLNLQAEFLEHGGTTRCEWWDTATATIHAPGGSPLATIQFANSWNHSGCGHMPSGVFLSVPGVDQGLPGTELTCNQTNIAQPEEATNE
jgi:hypothetical protein